MPFMQRITWSGIALHAGALPGYPASHGCIRMPVGFAEQLFDMTKLGLRVVVVRDDMRPVEFSHPALFKPGPIRSQVAAAAPAVPTRSADDLQTRRMRLGAPPPAATQAPRTWRAVAAARRAEAERLSEKTEEARRAAVKAHAEFARTMKSVRIAEHTVRRAEMQLAQVEREMGEKSSPELEEKKAAIGTALSEAKAQVDDLPCGGAGEASCGCCGPRGSAGGGDRKVGCRDRGQDCGEQAGAGVGAHQPADADALCPAGLPSDLRHAGDDPRSRRSDRHHHFHGGELHRRRRGRALDRARHVPGRDRDTANRWREGATPRRAAPSRAGRDRRRRCQGRDRARKHPAGGRRAHRRVHRRRAPR